MTIAEIATTQLKRVLTLMSQRQVQKNSAQQSEKAVQPQPQAKGEGEAKSEPQSGRIDRKRRGAVLLAVVAAGLVLSAVAFRVGREAETTRIQASFERTAGERVATVEARLLATVGSLRSLASFFETTGDVAPEKFTSFVTPLLSATAGVQAYEWVPLVSADERAHVEALGARNQMDFAITERGPEGKMRPAGTRERYFPVFYVDPLRGNEKAVGFDLYSNAARRAAIDSAIDTLTPQATARITLVQETGDQYGFLVFYPVFSHAQSGVANLRGVVLGVFRIGDVISQNARNALEDSNMTLSIWDLAADPDESLLYPKGDTRGGAVSRSRRGATSTISTSRELNVGGRPWKVVATATPTYVANERGFLPWAMLAAALCVTANIAWLIDRRFVVEEQVVARTAEMRQARDEAREANRAKSDFLATMSHEIRTPLNGVIAMADHLLEKELDQEQREPLEIIAKSSEHLLRVINDILDFSKLEARKLEFESRPFEIASLVGNVAETFAVQAEDKGLRLEVRIDPELPAFVAGDAARLRQILLNLVSNAIKFTAHGHVLIEASCRDESPDLGKQGSRCRLALAVRDSGVGMSEEAQSQLFTQFWQADSSISRRYGGTGLGLAISRRMAEQMGGDIQVASAPGVGSAFTLSVPVASAPAPAPERQERDPSAVSQNFAGRKILLVEDNPTNRRIACTILGRTGAWIDKACDGLEAVAAARTTSYDLILMDIHMPNMNGVDATLAIRALPAPFGRAPIVALSASAFDDDKAMCRAAGMNDFLAKPYRAGPLREIAARAMGSSREMSAPAHADEKHSAFYNDQPAFEFECFAVLGNEIGEDDARQLLNEFIADARHRLDDMRGCFARQEMLALKDAAHALKSSSAMLGLARLAAISKELEHVIAHQDFDRVETLNHAANTAFHDATPFIDEALKAA